jgi:hypothetical protein
MAIKGAGMKSKKLVAFAAAIIIPVGGLASVAAFSAGSASAVTRLAGDNGTYTCAIHGGTTTAPLANSTITFATPGISPNGSVGETSTSTTKVGAFTLPAGATCGATIGKSVTPAIKTASNLCSGGAVGSVTPPPNCTVDPVGAGSPGDWYYGSWNAFGSSGASSILAADPHPKFTIDGDAFTGNSTSAVATVGGQCTNNALANPTEAGFTISGSVNALEGYTSFSATVCLSAVTGSNLVDATNFLSNFGVATVKTAVVDPTNSIVTVS